MTFCQEAFTQEPKLRFKISYLEGVAGCGCGCPENDLNIGDQTTKKSYEFFGTRTQAQTDVREFALSHALSGYTPYDFSIQEIKQA